MTEPLHEHFTRPDGVTVDLYCGDCLDVLPTLGKVDAVVTDPPYGIGYVTGAGGTNYERGAYKKHYNTKIHGDDKKFDPSHLLGYSTVVLFGANNFSSLLPDSRGWVFWDKNNGVKANDFGDGELIYTNNDSVIRVFRHMWKGILRDSEIGDGSQHPTQKPVELMAWLVERYTKAGAIVLDAYMGSGTTGVAAVRLGRSFIGVEIEPKYYAIARRRILEALAQPALFQV